MKLLSKVLLVTLSLFLVGAVFAADEWQVPKTSVAPVIDGEVDGVWQNVPWMMCAVPDNADAVTVDDWFDSFGWNAMMWDADGNLYTFWTIYDDVINDGTDWNWDGVEIYFDGDDSKTEGAYDGVDDVQLRINTADVTNDDVDQGYGTVGTGVDAKANLEFAVMLTDLGYNIEAKWSLDDLLVAPEVGSVFGYDCQVNDNDDGAARETMLRWWGDDNNAWQDASFFGTAELIDKEVSEVLPVQMAGVAPVIDGEADEVWADANKTNALILDPETVMPEDWTDLSVTQKLLWDETNLYIWYTVIDDVINDGVDWNWDGVEVYFDGDDSKTEGAYDGVDDVQLRINTADVTTDDVDQGYGTAGAGPDAKANMDFFVMLTDDGYDIEAAFALDDMLVAPEAGSIFGYDCQPNDNDDGAARETMLRWWGASNNAWQDASLFGTVELKGGTAVESTTELRSFDLAQNYPNPFNPTTHITYNVPNRSNVKLSVYDMLGHNVANLVNEVKSAGSYEVQFDATNLTSGVYFYKLEMGQNVITKKMMLVK